MVLEGGAVDPAGEALAAEFVDLVNARDYEALAELLHPEIESSFLGVSGRTDFVEKLADLVQRNPGIVLTRGELGAEPIAVAWSRGDDGGYQRSGIVVFRYSDEDGTAVIDCMEYEDRDLDPDALLAEEPEAEDADEGQSWEEWETGEI